jgi:hypothetical protein
MIFEAKCQNFSTFQFDNEMSVNGQIIDLPNSDIFLFPKENYYTSEENYLNDIRQKQQTNGFAIKLISCIREQHFEYGITSNADILISEEMKKNKLATKATLNELFVNHYDNPSILIGILQVVSRNENIYPEGCMMATAALSHKNFEVRECGIRCFENWVSEATLKILKNISTEPQWLQDYLSTVIHNIEEELCHTS